MAGLLVAKKVVDPLAFEQTRYELKIGFTILHHVLATRVGFGQGAVEVGRRISPEYLRHDLRHGLVLKDAAVCAERQLPEPRAQGQPVA